MADGALLALWQSREGGRRRRLTGTLYRGYESEAGHAVDSGQIDYWEIMAAAKWSTIAVLQGDRYRKGGEQSIEAALTGLMAPEIELEALDGVLAQTVRKIG